MKTARIQLLLLAALLAVFCTVPVNAQVGLSLPQAIQYSAGAPAGACTSGMVNVDYTTPNIYTCVASAWVLTGGGGGSNAFTDQCVTTAISSTVINFSRCRVGVGNVTISTPATRCTITPDVPATGSGTARLSTATTGFTVLKYPTSAAQSVACAVAPGDAVGPGEQIITPTEVPTPDYEENGLAQILIVAGAWSTITNLTSPVTSTPIVGTDGILATLTAGNMVLARDPSILCSLIGTCAITGTWDMRASTASFSARNGSGAPSAGSCTAANVNATYSRTDVVSGSPDYTCTQSSSGVYTWVLIGGSSGVTNTTRVIGIPVDNNSQMANFGDNFGAALATPYYMAITVPQSSATAIQLEINSLTLAGSNGFAVALYDSTCAKVSENAQVISSTGPGVTNFTLPSTASLSAGTAYIGIAYEHSAAAFRQLYIGGLVSGTIWMSQRNPSGSPTKFSFFNTAGAAATGSGASIVMPASCATGTRTALANAPIIGAIIP